MLGRDWTSREQSGVVGEGAEQDTDKRGGGLSWEKILVNLETWGEVEGEKVGAEHQESSRRIQMKQKREE